MSHPPPRAPDDAPDPRADRARFRRTLVRVMAVQVITLILLWLLQRGFAA
jgi:hypothetical protein